MSDEKLRFGIVGPGTIAHVHYRAIMQSDGAEVVAVYGRNADRVQEFADQYGITAYHDLASFMASDTIDAVTIATASGTHLEIGLQAALHGKHVLCEKPLEITSQRCADLIVACARQRVKLGVLFQARFAACARQAKAAIDSGRLGKILFASCQMRWYRSQDYYDSAAWRGTWVLDGGGSLMNQGIHSVDLLLHLAGDPASVTAMLGPRTHERIEVEDNLAALLKFQNGAIGTIEVSTSCAPGFPRRLEISGERGTIGIEGDSIVRWDFVDHQPEDDLIRSQAVVGLGGAADPTAIGDHGHCLAFADFIQSIQQDRRPLIDGLEGKRSVDLICAVYESMTTGSTVNLG
jgi:predicted dehydrogenase